MSLDSINYKETTDQEQGITDHVLLLESTQNAESLQRSLKRRNLWDLGGKPGASGITELGKQVLQESVSDAAERLTWKEKQNSSWD